MKERKDSTCQETTTQQAFGVDAIVMPCYMMATKASHKLGDLSRDDEDLCRIEKDDGSDYIGSWVTGFGFFNVKFPKETTRALTNAEIKKYNKKYVQIGNQPAMRLNVD